MTSNTHITVTLTSELRLVQALIEADIEDPAKITRLSVAGMITNNDFAYIRENMGKTLQELDMLDALFETGIIGWEGLKGCSGLKSVIIPDSVELIDNWVFEGCTGLTSVAIPASVKSIGSSAFRDCTGLTSISIPASVITIGSGAFGGCTGLTSVAIPDSVTEIGYVAFDGCTGLISVTIPASVIEIGEAAFCECSSLTSIEVHHDNPEYTSENGVLFNKDKSELIVFPAGRQGDYVIPDSVVKIRDWAFSDCAGLTSVTIPDSVKEIEEGTFVNCPAFITVDPDNLI